ncbi:MAG: hypothetical protein GY822_16940 [Deltaproteobacteria bacterium]|nr:hypothetical protein [Deltaproteobacteria bacterium]
MRDDEKVRDFTDGLDFELSWLNRHRLWWLPYATHAVIALSIAYSFDAWLLAGAYFFGMLSHPLQGGLVNAIGHAVGGRNFETDEESPNNLIAAMLVASEGFQNNHQAFPASAKFSYQPWEVDFRFGACVAMKTFGFLTIETKTLIPAPSQHAFDEAAAVKV